MRLFRKKIITVTYAIRGKKTIKRYEVRPTSLKNVYKLYINANEYIEVRVEL